MYLICGWYSLILSIVAMIVTILKDGKSTTNYTGGFKLLTILINMPMLYFVCATLFN